MPQKQQMRSCRQCGHKTLQFIDTPNHIFHLLVSCITFGLWIPIWFIAAFQVKPWQCTSCGKKAVL